MKAQKTPVNSLFFETWILSPPVKVNCCWVQTMDKLSLWLEIWAMAGPGSSAGWFVAGLNLVQSVKDGVSSVTAHFIIFVVLNLTFNVYWVSSPRVIIWRAILKVVTLFLSIEDSSMTVWSDLQSLETTARRSPNIRDPSILCGGEQIVCPGKQVLLASQLINLPRAKDWFFFFFSFSFGPLQSCCCSPTCMFRIPAVLVVVFTPAAHVLLKGCLEKVGY